MRTSQVLIALFALTSFGCATLPSGEDRRPAAAAAPRLPDISGITPDSGNSGVTTFIYPNEWDFWRFEPVLRDMNGALISVGTFRALNHAAFGEFSNVVLFDSDPTIVRFNALNLELIRKSPTREVYLRNLLGKDEANALLSQDKAAFDVELGKWTKAVEAVASTRRSDVKIPPWIEALESDVPHQLGRDLIQRLSEEYFRSRSAQHFFFDSAVAYERIFRLVSEGRIQVLRGDLAGATTLTELGRILRDAKIEVSALDLSNAFEYLDEIARFFENLRALPFSKNARVLMTSDYSRSGSSADSWSYYATKPETFLAAQDAIVMQKDKLLIGFHQKLRNTSDDLNHSKHEAWPCSHFFSAP